MVNLLLGPLVGGLCHNRAFLWGRADGPATLHAWLGQSPDLSDGQLAGKSLELRAEDGFSGVAPVHNLTPNTHYHYHLAIDETPPSRSEGPYPSFTTFPLPGLPASFAFSFGSCFRPADENGGKIFYTLEAKRRERELRFILLLGDQIYADAFRHNGLGRVACSLEDYRAVYAYTWSRPPFRQLLQNLPAFMTLDDHEVDDDWRWTDITRQVAYIPIWDRIERLLKGRLRQEWLIPVQRVQDALKAYWEHQGMHAPPFEIPLPVDQEGQYKLLPQNPGSLAYTFTFGAAAFFVMDTRTMRVRGRHVRSMLGEGQWHVLEEWLLSVKDTYPVKFLVTSCSMLFDMWLDFPRDRWSGFPEERNRLLHFLAAHGIENVYLLAGDLHSAHAVSADLYGPQGRSLPVWEFCSTPFEQKPNTLSKRTYVRLRSGPVKQQELHFCLGLNNFGLVQVDFDCTARPRVCFELYDEKGKLLARAGG